MAQKDLKELLAAIQPADDAKFGSFVLKDAVGDVPSDVWDFASDDITAGGVVKTFPDAAGTIFVCSDNVADTAAEVTAEYIDANGKEASVVLTPTGTTPLNIGFTGFDVNRAFESGDTAFQGNVYFTTESNHVAGVPQDNTKVLAFIRAGHGQTQQSMRSIPAGKVLKVRWMRPEISRASGAAGSAEIDFCTRQIGKTTLIKRRIFPTVGNAPPIPEAGLNIFGHAICFFRVVDISDNETNVTITWGYDLEDA